MNTENRDVLCAAEVGRMAELGRFGKELNVYGTAYLEKGKVTFRLTSAPLALYTFVEKAPSKNCYPTSVLHLVRRTVVPAGMEEALSFVAKCDLASDIQKTYPYSFFKNIALLSKASTVNSAVPFFEEAAYILQGRYDDLALQVYESSLRRAYQGKLLDRYEYERFLEKIRKVRWQMEDDPVPGARFKRTFYGFVYDDGGCRRPFFDAVAETVWAEYTVRTLAGDMLGPVLTKTYWLDNFGSMAAVRRDFKAQLLDYEGDRYFAFAHALDTLPSAVSQEQFEKARVELEQQNAFRAVQDLCRYGRLWNVLE